MKKALLIALSLVLAVVVGVVGWVYADSTASIRRTYALNTVVPPIPSDSASIERGRHIAQAIAACAACHGENLAGQVYIDQQPVATLVPSNLTPGHGGIDSTMTDADWVNAIRHGVGRDGRTLFLMPAEVYQAMSDEDLGALIAYLKRLPPVDNVLPPSRIGPVGRALEVFDKAPFFTAEHVDHDRAPVARIEAGLDPRYGYYLTRMGGCIGCHGNDLAGRPVPGAPKEIPPAANLTPGGIAHYTEVDFIRALREGRRPDGRPINPIMPLTTTKHLTEDEMRAIFAYLKSLPAREFGRNISKRSIGPA